MGWITKKFAEHIKEADAHTQVAERARNGTQSSGANGVPDDMTLKAAEHDRYAEVNLESAASLLKHAREELGLTQAELADRAGVKKSLIADIEYGRRKFTEKVEAPILRAIVKEHEVRHQTSLRPVVTNRLRLLIEPEKLSTDELLAFTVSDLAEAQSQLSEAQDRVVSLKLRLNMLQRAKQAEEQIQRHQAVIDALERIEARKEQLQALKAQGKADTSQIELLRRINEYEHRSADEQDEEKSREIILQFDAELSSL